MIKKLAPYVGAYKKEAILAPITVILEVLLEIFIPFLMSKIVDIGIANSDIGYVVRIGIMMLVMAMFSLLFGALSGRYASVASVGFAKNIRSALFKKIQDFSFFNVDKFSTPSLVTRLTADITNTQLAFMLIIRILVRAPIMLFCATFMVIKINAQLATIFLVAIPFLGAVLAIIATKAFPLFQKMLDKYDSMNASVQENLIAIRVVKAFVREDHESQKFREASETLMHAQIKAERFMIILMPAMMFTMYGCMIAISWFGGRQIIAGQMLTGELMGFISYVMQILMSLMMISMIFVMLVLSRASVTRIVEVFDEEIDIIDTDADENLTVKNGAIKFENVSFSYSKNEERPVLKNINLSINSGEVVGIVGGTGSAKTTLVQLIPRLYDATKGRVSVGGNDVRDYKIHNLRDKVAMVLQKNVLFSGTIKENLKWGNDNATDEEITAACKAAQAHEFIMSFPDGYETDLGQGGVNVSGGQKQRLCIARALLKDPKIIILDDSTSAVDTATDAKIRQSLSETHQDLTMIIIAQRINSVMHADKIIVMDNGHIDAVGTHSDLLATNQIYREVFESQQRGVA